MGKNSSESSTTIPTVDLSPFMEGGDESRRKEVMEAISDACTNLGVFEIVNHGVSLEDSDKFLKLNKEFFSYPEEEKINSTKDDPPEPKSGNGYGKFSDKFHKFEYLLMHSPEIYTQNNGVPVTPLDYSKTFVELFKSLTKTAQLLEDIINDCLELPANYLKDHNDDRSWDFMMPMYYTQANKTLDIGIINHEDPQFITITLQDDVCGLEAYEDDQGWISTDPTKIKLTVVIGDILQVLSNKKNKNVTHRTFKNHDSTRLAIDFAYSYGPDKWIEPLMKLLPGEAGKNPKYKGFVYKDYIDLVAKDYNNPPTDITYYEI